MQRRKILDLLEREEVVEVWLEVGDIPEDSVLDSLLFSSIFILQLGRDNLKLKRTSRVPILPLACTCS